MEGSRVYVDLARVPGNPETGTAGQAVFTIKNISANPLNIRADELTERFVRGDVARTTEGSGLGLSLSLIHISPVQQTWHPDQPGLRPASGYLSAVRYGWHLRQT